MANNIQPEMIRTTKNQRERFAYALEQVVGKDHVRDGIGTLSEKTVHAVLKYYYEQDQSHHEIILEKSKRNSDILSLKDYSASIEKIMRKKDIITTDSRNQQRSSWILTDKITQDN